MCNKLHALGNDAFWQTFIAGRVEADQQRLPATKMSGLLDMSETLNYIYAGKNSIIQLLPIKKDKKREYN